MRRAFVERHRQLVAGRLPLGVSARQRVAALRVCSCRRPVATDAAGPLVYMPSRSSACWHGFCITQRMKTWIQILLALPAVCLNAQALAQTGEKWHDHEAIRDAATRAIVGEWLPPGGRVEAAADELDSRIRLAACAEDLDVSVPFQSGNASRATALVRCHGPRPWKLHVPVRLTVFQPVVVTTRAMPRDSVLTADDISLAERDTGALDYGFLSAARDAVGQRLRRPLAAGDAVSPGHLEMPALVKRGQQVTLVARNGGLNIRQSGVAQEDGVRGQVIGVRNDSSGREVEAIVRSARSVEVLLQ